MNPSLTTWLQKAKAITIAVSTFALFYADGMLPPGAASVTKTIAGLLLTILVGDAAHANFAGVQAAKISAGLDAGLPLGHPAQPVPPSRQGP